MEVGGKAGLIEVPLNVPLLRETFEALAPRGEAWVKRFYERLFERNPEVARLFADRPMEDQRSQFLAALVTIVNSLHEPASLVATLGRLGQRHRGYGVQAHHYRIAMSVLLDVMRESAGELWSREAEAAWTDALDLISSAMLGTYPLERDRVISSDAVLDDAASVRMRAAVDNSMTAIVTIDTDLNVTYANRATTELL